MNSIFSSLARRSNPVKLHQKEILQNAQGNSVPVYLRKSGDKILTYISYGITTLFALKTLSMCSRIQKKQNA